MALVEKPAKQNPDLRWLPRNQSRSDCLGLSVGKGSPGLTETPWQKRLESALSRNFSQTSWGVYNRGMINDALGHAADAEADFRMALLLPDGLLAYHLTRLALFHNSP
jgi:hypothetical protein